MGTYGFLLLLALFAKTRWSHSRHKTAGAIRPLALRPADAIATRGAKSLVQRAKATRGAKLLVRNGHSRYGPLVQKPLAAQIRLRTRPDDDNIEATRGANPLVQDGHTTRPDGANANATRGTNRWCSATLVTARWCTKPLAAQTGTRPDGANANSHSRHKSLVQICHSRHKSAGANGHSRQNPAGEHKYRPTELTRPLRCRTATVDLLFCAFLRFFLFSFCSGPPFRGVYCVAPSVHHHSQCLVRSSLLPASP